jgi:hypothetical protein
MKDVEWCQHGVTKCAEWCRHVVGVVLPEPKGWVLKGGLSCAAPTTPSLCEAVEIPLVVVVDE